MQNRYVLVIEPISDTHLHFSAAAVDSRAVSDLIMMMQMGYIYNKD